MGVKKYSMKNALTVAIFASLLLFSTTIVAAERAGSPDSPGNSGQNRPDNPPGLDNQGKENPPNRPVTSPGQDDKDKDKDKG